MKLNLICQSERVLREHVITDTAAKCLSCFDTNEIDVDALYRLLSDLMNVEEIILEERERA